MNYKANMKKAIRMEAAGKGLIVGAVLSILWLAVMWFSRFNFGYVVPVVIVLIACAVTTLIAVLLSLFKSSSLMSRIRSLEKVSGDMNYDTIRSVSDDTFMGDKWLITRRGTKFSAWTKDMISTLNMDVRNPNAKKAILEITDHNGRTEKVIVSRTDALSDRIDDWMREETEEVLI